MSGDGHPPVRDSRFPVAIEDPPEPSGAAPHITVAIPTKNRPDFIRATLARLREHDGPEREVIVADGSTDERSAAILAAEFPDVRLVRVRGPHNIPFARNECLRLCRGQVIVFVDDDSIVEPGWLERLVRHYDDRTVGAVGGRIVDELFAAKEVGDAIGRVEANGRIHLNFTLDPGQVVEVDQMIGCNMSLRVETLRAVGGFDTWYMGPSFMEETDLCGRIRQAGARILFDPAAVVQHRNAPRDRGMERVELDPQVQFWSARSRAYFAWKQLPRTIAVLRYNALGNLKLHAIRAVRERSLLHLRAIVLQSLGLVSGSVDWLRAGRPRRPLFERAPQ